MIDPIGSLSLKLEEINSSVVGAQLGSAAVSTSVKAGAIGIVLIILFLAIVYRLPGIAAGWALLIYVELNLIALNAFDLTLTLPGIAGVILSIGMAVDANVIIYARIEEEIGAGKTVHLCRSGYKIIIITLYILYYGKEENDPYYSGSRSGRGRRRYRVKR